MSTLTKDTIAKNVAANFKYVRTQLGLSQSAMGDKLEIPFKTMQQIEYGRANTPHHVYKLSKLISVSMDTIFTSELSNQNQ